MKEPIKITPAMMAAIAAPMPNFHVMWERYRTSSFRRDWLATWAGDDADKQRAVQDLLNEPNQKL